MYIYAHGMTDRKWLHFPPRFKVSSDLENEPYQKYNCPEHCENKEPSTKNQIQEVLASLCKMKSLRG